MKIETPTANDAGQLTASPVAVPAVTAKPILPEWGRLPKSGTLCPWTGLSRSALNAVVLPCAANGNTPPVRSVCLRKKGAATGIRLIHLRSLLDYLNEQARIQPVVLPRKRRTLDQSADATGAA